MLTMTRRLLLAGLVTLALAACESPVTVQRFPDITFTHVPPLGLNVSKVDIGSNVKPTMEAPYVGHLFPVPPEKAMRRWAEDRLAAKGVSGTARFTVVEAFVTETPLDVKGGLTGAFTKQQAVRYEATVAGMLEIVDDNGFRQAFASSRVSRTHTVREDATLNERDRVRFELIENLMKDFDNEMTRDIRSHVGGHLI